MKIIFLDIDGVLCTFRSHIGQDQHGQPGTMKALDREAVGLLNVLAEAGGTPVHYVLSSTWRRHFTKESMTAHLRSFGWRGEFHDDWRTVVRSHSGFRGHEVRDWLLSHPGTVDWIAFDDNSDFSPDQKPRLILTHEYDGMSWQNFLDANRILHGAAERHSRSSAGRQGARAIAGCVASASPPTSRLLSTGCCTKRDGYDRSLRNAPADRPAHQGGASARP